VGVSARKRPPKVPHAGHDHGYKLLFSHSQTIAELIRGFLPPDWVERLDLCTLERAGNEFTSGDLRERRSDIIWRMHWKGERETWLYLLLEFQSTIDPFMAVRLLTYAGLLLEEILRKEKLKPGAEIPVVLPVVLYNGRLPWRAPLDLVSLSIEAPESLLGHLPRLRYLLLDEKRLDLDRPELARNTIALLFRIETSREPAEVSRWIRELSALLPRDEALRRTITVWLASVLRRTFPGVIIPEVADLEADTMTILEANMRKWQRKVRAESMREILLRQIERRFGPLPEEKRRRLEAITSHARLKQLADQILIAQSLQEMGI
jgi:hypothetical protein